MEEIKWYKSESTIEPKRVDTESSPNGVYLRKLIHQETRSYDSKSENLVYSYLEAFITKEQYKEYSFIQSILSQVFGEEDTDSYLEYQFKLDTPILYEANNHYYKPKWANSIYADLITKAQAYPDLLPITIWDSTGLENNAVEMSLDELVDLTKFLAKKQEQFYYEYKLKKSEENSPAEALVAEADQAEDLTPSAVTKNDIEKE